MHQALAYIPLVRRHLEVSLELLFERRERPIANLGELFDGDILEHVVIDNLLEVATGNVHIAQQLTLQTTISVRDYQIEQLCEFYILGGLVVTEQLLAQVTVGIHKETLCCTPRRHRYVIARATSLTGVVVCEAHAIGYAQMREDMLQTCRCVVEHNLLKGTILLADILHVVMSNTHIEHLATAYRIAFVTIVYVLGAVQNIADSVARKGYRPDV